MAVTKGAMTSLPTSQAIYLTPVEDTENNCINFRDSLKFFQEQLVINGTSFPSPSPAGRTGNGTLKKNGPRFSKKLKSDTNGKERKDCDIFEGDVQSVRGCKISIPTVDTILESVRVLRAIQKSQKEQGSNWNLDVISKATIESDFSVTREWIQACDVNENVFETELKEVNNGLGSPDRVTPKLPKVESKGSSDSTPDSTLINRGLNTSSENNSFWPSNSFINENLDNENVTADRICSVELTDTTAEFHVHTLNTEILEREGSLAVEPTNKNKQNCSNGFGQNELNKNDENATNESENISYTQNHETNVKKSLHNPESLSDVCRDILKYVNVENPHTENVREHEDSITGILNIETYEDVDSHKDFLLNDSAWKEKCSPSGSSSTKQENNDSDSGIGTQRSASSLSPNIPNRIQKDFWSDTCSSQYASAECSPYHSLNCVFDSSISQPAFEKEDIKWEDALETTEEINTEICDQEKHPAISHPQTEPNSEIISVLNETHAESEEKTCIPVLNENQTEHNRETSISLRNETHTEPERNTSITLIEEIHTEPKTEECISFPEEIYTEPQKENDVSVLQEKHTKHKYENGISVLEGNHAEPNTETGISVLDETETDAHVQLKSPENGESIEQDTESSYCFVSNYTLEKPMLCKTSEQLEESRTISENNTLDKLPKTVNGNHVTTDESLTSNVKTTDSMHNSKQLSEKEIEEEDSCDTDRLKTKFTAASCDLMSIVESLYAVQQSPEFQVLPGPDDRFQETLCILSEGAFCDHPEGDYLVSIEDCTLYITKDSQILLSLNMKYGEVSVGMKNTLKVDNRMGRFVYIKCEFESMIDLKTEIELHCLKHWRTDCLQLVHYPLKYHQNVIIVDLGSCSTRAGILMDQPTLPTIFFPTICATNRKTGANVYGMEALQPEVRQHSNLSFPVRPSIKITKHTIDIDLLEGLFRKIFTDLRVDPTDYTVQVCLPRNLSIPAQNALVKLLLENLKVKSVSLANQSLLTLYAHDVSTAVVVDIGDRTEVLPIVDGFIVESGVTKLPHGGQRLIHHMKHGLAEKRLSLSSDVDSFIVQYIIENLAYVASDYNIEMQLASKYPDLLQKTITLQPASSETSACKSITLEETRFKLCEGLFDPELWGVDSPGIHHLVNKAIQATGVDVRKRIAENIYVSGGVTMLPGFVERLSKEVAKLSKAKIVPKVFASNYRYHATYIGACKFSKMEVFPQVCINLEEYSRNSVSALKKCALCF